METHEIDLLVAELKLHRPIIPAPGWRVLRVFLDGSAKGFGVHEHIPLGWQVQDGGRYKLVCASKLYSFVAAASTYYFWGYEYVDPSQPTPTNDYLLTVARHAMAEFLHNMCQKSDSVRKTVAELLIKADRRPLVWDSLDDFYGLETETLFQLGQEIGEPE